MWTTVSPRHGDLLRHRRQAIGADLDLIRAGHGCREREAAAGVGREVHPRTRRAAVHVQEHHRRPHDRAPVLSLTVPLIALVPGVKFCPVRMLPPPTATPLKSG